ncbi:DUF4124 domain-containing protein [Leptothrix discophora]|uniref:DUF4124 domain-containing protein n=1 Tax=Leptothrix discophora TaxID=89 RepID=A0ABT9G3M9_LEPDI|nr:DUF4124 domain-containing protein [Leptothrix discophora]MDP4301062.1 DUF4124 domain-containing protein [Leptothrix discophora]
MTTRRVARAGVALSTLGLLCALAASPALAQNSAGIYTCIDAKGRRLTSDRPIPECLDRQQDLRNKDGSVRARVMPSLTAEERAAQEEAQRAEMVRDAARRDALRHDRNLLNRYPDEPAHQRAREAALEPLKQALHGVEKRLAVLEVEQKALHEEAEFYKGKDLPRKLKVRFDDNKTSIEAQRTSASTHESELQRINARYDEELARLRKLWAGAAPGSLGPAPSTVLAR